MEGTEVEIADVRQVGPGTVAFRVATPPGFEARPGQFVQVRATVDGEPVTRHYSVSSADADGTFELTVGIDPDGTLTPRLADATPGDVLEVDGPFGRVFYEGEDRVAVLAAGPGIGAAVGVAEATLARGGDAALVYRTDRLVHEDRLARLAVAGAREYVNITIAFAAASDRAFAAAVQESIETFDGGPQFFVYGFEPFVETAGSALADAGGDPRAAKVENFG
jgi:3-phenylpropionate/trans-cinnamate dioxygenase ferredoxin reductase subunit